jgi:hypothetical protein
MTRIFRGSITNKRELFNYVVCVTAVCVAIALAVDVTNQLAFFVDWATCLRSWAITIILVLALAIPISRMIGNAHLQLYQAKSLAEQLSRTDQLTGLPNRRALMEAVSTAKLETLALVIVDIDRFKRVNDTHGHLAGDAVIRTIGQMMATDFGEVGQVARVGGEEFCAAFIWRLGWSLDGETGRLLRQGRIDARTHQWFGRSRDRFGGTRAAPEERDVRPTLFGGRSCALRGEGLRSQSGQGSRRQRSVLRQARWRHGRLASGPILAERLKRR